LDTAAASVATKIKVKRLTGTMSMFAQLNKEQEPYLPKVSALAQIVLDAGSKADTTRAYNTALVATVETMVKPEATNYLRRTKSVPNNGGYTEYMTTCFVHCFYRDTLLQLIVKVALVKTSSSVVYHIPHFDTGAEADSLPENTNHTNTMLMSEVATNFSGVVCTVKVNNIFGSYSEMLGLLGNIWLQKQVIFEQELTFCLTLFVKVLGNVVCARAGSFANL
jgi:hypothetical protein